MSAGVTTTHDKYPPFTRAELQELRDRAAWLGANYFDPRDVHLRLASEADHLDAILARAEAKPDLKLYDPNADTELYVPAGEPHPFASAGPGLRGATSEVPSENAARMREVLASMPVGGWTAVPEADLAPAKSFTGLVAPHPEGGMDTGRRLGVLRALHRYHDLLTSQNGLPGGLKTAAARLIHSELATIAVKMSPNPVDDVVLELLRALVPKP